MTEFKISKQTLFSLLQDIGSTSEIEDVGAECGFTMEDYEKWEKQRC